MSDLIRILNKAKEAIGDSDIGVFIDENMNIRSADLQDEIVPVHRVLVTDFYSHKYSHSPAYPYPHFGSFHSEGPDGSYTKTFRMTETRGASPRIYSWGLAALLDYERMLSYFSITRIIEE